ncbi:hypothetical protein PV08_08098 [Exophiala spinifera]|uniref:Uncharacterized protein n=1 Tax=Exophiala spinifera TaxID=91928 RepID=A0A0D1YD80_9EURO|nr:uncharacterized protein PV08_08098 [Exophiala spinifera]KIW12911.1 hypothetical protein PV08_08098 [Exophiala spinifera]
MPPRQDGPPKTFTFITGDPRSKQNITQIRRHAGQSSAAKASYLGGIPSARPSPPPNPQQSADTVQTQLSDNGYQHQPGRHSSSISAEAATPRIRISSPDTVSKSQDTCASQVRRLTIDDLVNAVPDQNDNSDSRREVSESSPRRGNARGQTVQQSEGAVLTATPGHPHRKDHPSTSQDRSHRSWNKASSSRRPASKGVFRAIPNVSKRHKHSLAASSLVSWRCGPSPNFLIPLSRDESHIARVLQKTSEFYISSFESTWLPLLHHNSSVFDGISTIENFSGSISTAASLISINHIEPATRILNRIVSDLQSLLTIEHPQLYYVLAELSLDTSDTGIGRLRAELKTLASGMADSALGRHHPIAELLRLRLTPAVSTRLRELIQRKVRSLYATFFTSTSYQAIGQSYFLARLLSHLNQPNEAMEILAWFIRTSEVSFGSQSLMPVTGLLELAKVHLSQAQLTDTHMTDTSPAPDSTLRAEELASDALNRTLGLDPSNTVPPLSTTIVHARIGCLRTLGRVHLMRQNFATATQYYSEAVRIGGEQLGPDVPAVQLALADLVGASDLAMKADMHIGSTVMGPHSSAALLQELSSINITAVL